MEKVYRYENLLINELTSAVDKIISGVSKSKYITKTYIKYIENADELPLITMNLKRIGVIKIDKENKITDISFTNETIAFRFSRIKHKFINKFINKNKCGDMMVYTWMPYSNNAFFTNIITKEIDKIIENNNMLMPNSAISVHRKRTTKPRYYSIVLGDTIIGEINVTNSKHMISSIITSIKFIKYVDILSSEEFTNKYKGIYMLTSVSEL